jgi:hypothetical protein
MTHPRISILSAPLAQRVTEAYFERTEVKLGQPARFTTIESAYEDTPYGVRVLVRSAHRGGRSNFNGTVHIAAERITHLAFRHGKYAKRLTLSECYVREATYDTLYRAIAYRIEKLYDLLPPDLLTLREELYTLRQRKGTIDEAQRNWGVALGRDTKFIHMTEADCHYWMDILNAMEDKE